MTTLCGHCDEETTTIVDTSSGMIPAHPECVDDALNDPETRVELKADVITMCTLGGMTVYDGEQGEHVHTVTILDNEVTYSCDDKESLVPVAEMIVHAFFKGGL